MPHKMQINFKDVIIQNSLISIFRVKSAFYYLRIYFTSERVSSGAKCEILTHCIEDLWCEGKVQISIVFLKNTDHGKECDSGNQLVK